MNQFSRRMFLATAAAVAPVSAATRKMTMQLSCGAIGVKADQWQSLDYAARYGFESIDAYTAPLAAMSGADLDRLKQQMADKKIVWANAGLPVDFRQSEEKFADDLKKLPEQARGLQRASVNRVTTWLSPTSDSLTYIENFKQHVRRIKEMAIVLGDSGHRLGLEYVGPKTSWTARRYPFIHSMREMKELIAETGRSNIGFVLDSWHWYTAGESAVELRTLTNKDVVSIDLNDAPSGIPVDQQKDGSRELPTATGVIDVASFLNTLNELGCDAPVRCEPFNQPLRNMPADQALETTASALKKAFALIRS